MFLAFLLLLVLLFVLLDKVSFREGISNEIKIKQDLNRNYGKIDKNLKDVGKIFKTLLI